MRDQSDRGGDVVEKAAVVQNEAAIRSKQHTKSPLATFERGNRLLEMDAVQPSSQQPEDKS